MHEPFSIDRLRQLADDEVLAAAGVGGVNQLHFARPALHGFMRDHVRTIILMLERMELLERTTNELQRLSHCPENAPLKDWLRKLIEERQAGLEALEACVSIVDRAGLLNLSNGVQLGQTSWYVKAAERLDHARRVLDDAHKTCDASRSTGEVEIGGEKFPAGSTVAHTPWGTVVQPPSSRAED